MYVVDNDFPSIDTGMASILTGVMKQYCYYKGQALPHWVEDNELVGLFRIIKNNKVFAITKWLSCDCENPGRMACKNKDGICPFLHLNKNAIEKAAQYPEPASVQKTQGRQPTTAPPASMIKQA